MIDKPGTTGETLSVLMHALHGLDYKLRIVLNRADQFTNIHDFARYVYILFIYQCPYVIFDVSAAMDHYAGT